MGWSIWLPTAWAAWSARAAMSLPARRKVQHGGAAGLTQRGILCRVQAVRGTYPVVRKLAPLDARTSAEQLAEEVFNTFPSLYHLLPPPGHTQPIDLFDARNGRARARAPRGTAAAAREGRAGPGQGERALFGGGRYGAATVTGIERVQDDFVYTVTPHGDGTVPVVSARLDGAPHLLCGLRAQ